MKFIGEIVKILTIIAGVVLLVIITPVLIVNALVCKVKDGKPFGNNIAMWYENVLLIAGDIGDTIKNNFSLE